MLNYVFKSEAEIGIGKPTRMKNLAKACDKCSLYGGSNLSLFGLRETNSLMNFNGRLYIELKSMSDGSLSNPFRVQRAIIDHLCT